MKKTLTTILIAGLFTLTAARAQTNDVGTNQPVTAVESTTSATVVVDTNAPVATAPAVAVSTTNVETTTTVAVTTVAIPSDASTNVVITDGTNVIPLIHIEDVPLTTAIENLARQANINYLLDPKIGFGQPDQTGQVKPEPSLSIRWENITAEHALLALLDNYGLQLILDRTTRIGRITLKDPLALPPLNTRVVQLKYSSVSNMTDAVQSVLTDKRSRVLADSRTSQLVVVATDIEQASVDTLIAQLDKPTREVLIETRLVEISSNPTSAKGIDWSGTLQAQNIAFGNGSLSGTYNSAASTTTTASSGGANHPATTTDSGTTLVPNLTSVIGSGGLSASTASGLMPDVGFLNADGLHAVLSFLNSSSDAQVMSTPRIVTLDNEEAHIEVTRGYPIFNVSSSSANNSGGSSVTYSNIGTKLRVTPRITASDNIWLKVVPEVSSFFGNFSQTAGGGANGGNQTLTAPVFDVRTFTTQVLVHNQNTLVMGGLVKDNPQSTTTKVPLLGDIPVLGYAFHSESKSVDKDNLLVFITPTIVKDTDFQTPLPESTTFLKSSPDAKRASVMDANSMWDSTEPHDWSNPKGRVTDSQ